MCNPDIAQIIADMTDEELDALDGRLERRRVRREREAIQTHQEEMRRKYSCPNCGKSTTARERKSERCDTCRCSIQRY